MSYKDFVQKPISPEKLAPLSAQPKMTKGDSHAYRRRVKAMKKRGVIYLNNVPLKKNGNPHLAKTKKIMEEKNGRPDEK